MNTDLEHHLHGLAEVSVPELGDPWVGVAGRVRRRDVRRRVASRLAVVALLVAGGVAGIDLLGTSPMPYASAGVQVPARHIIATGTFEGHRWTVSGRYVSPCTIKVSSGPLAGQPKYLIAMNGSTGNQAVLATTWLDDRKYNEVCDNSAFPLPGLAHELFNYSGSTIDRTSLTIWSGWTEAQVDHVVIHFSGGVELTVPAVTVDPRVPMKYVAFATAHSRATHVTIFGTNNRVLAELAAKS